MEFLESMADSLLGENKAENLRLPSYLTQAALRERFLSLFINRFAEKERPFWLIFDNAENIAREK